MKNIRRIALLCLALLLLLLPAAGATGIQDVGEGQFEEAAEQAILSIVGNGILPLDENGNYYPEAPTERALFLEMLYRAVGMPEAPAPDFTDVPATARYADAIGWAQGEGLLADSENAGEFGPELFLSRQDASTYIYRLLLKEAARLADVGDYRLERFADSADVADYAKEALPTILSLGLLVDFGDELLPYSAVSRAEAALLICGYFDAIGADMAEYYYDDGIDPYFTPEPAAQSDGMDLEAQSAHYQGGHITRIGDTLYFLSEGHLHSMEPDGSERQQHIPAYQAIYLTQQEGRLFFLQPGGDNGENSLQYDLYGWWPGDAEAVLLRTNVQSYALRGGLLYYIEEEGDTVYSVPLDAQLEGEPEPLYQRADSATEDLLCVQDMLVLLTSSEENHSLVLYDLQTGLSREYALHDPWASCPQFTDGLVLTLDANGNIERSSFDRETLNITFESNIFEAAAAFAAAAEDLLYVVSADNIVYRTDFSGVNPEETGRFGEGIIVLEPMGGRLWAFSLSEDGANFVGEFGVLS